MRMDAFLLACATFVAVAILRLWVWERKKRKAEWWREYGKRETTPATKTSRRGSRK